MNDAVIAVAGWGKTEELASAVAREVNPERVLVLTYTETNQLEDTVRISKKAQATKKHATIMGWKAFQIHDIVRPYLPTLYPSRKLRGLANQDVDLRKHPKGAERYLTVNHDAYPGLLGKLTFDVIKSSNGAAIDRLECLYDSIYIDEAQDLRGNDLCVLEVLLRSKIDIHVFLDPRQSTLSTAHQDRKYKMNYPNAKIIELYREWERKGLLQIRYENITHRSIQEIATLSDLIIDTKLKFDRTVSAVKPRGKHDGIYVIDRFNLDKYVAQYNATLLALQKSTEYGIDDAINFKKAKGMTRNDIVIMATSPIEKFLSTGAPLAPESACGFYVAVTRARYSVAIAVKHPDKIMKEIASNPLLGDIEFNFLAL